jgi:hypothetical protein
MKCVLSGLAILYRVAAIRLVTLATIRSDIIAFNVMQKTLMLQKMLMLKSSVSVMSRRLFLGALGTLLFVGSYLNTSWAQNGSESPTPALLFLSGAEITSQLNYSCPSNACSFVCSGAGQLGADHVTKLTIYLETVLLGNGKSALVLLYDFSTGERPSSGGFSISAGLSASSCQVIGLTLDYVGRPPPRQQGLSPETQ